ncbi:PREDICTED: phytolongin Phyl1.1-like [Tarenaya hassleriana]|uniref:phytolongin Phyl1.1-like n=1 Tax=Tarenaya hassleriana TaxID=28532 RepID=UPI00053C5F4A|nr:PREDICTED: phytolongin Phyl1.1-like [Tarenaya hassleriana]
MGPTQNTVHYCCVSRDNQILYSYNGGDPITTAKNLAALCLEKTPSFHKWYFETIGKRTFGFLMEDGLVYFAIVDEGLRRSRVLEFLEHLRDEFKKAAKRNSRGSFSGMISSVNALQEQLVPVVCKLIASLERVSETTCDLKANLTCLSSSSPAVESAEQSEGSNSTKAPLLGRSIKQEKKKKGKDHVISFRGIELEEHRKSTDRENKSEGSDANSAASSLEKDYPPRRGRSGGSQNIERKWRRQVQIVLAIDVAICLTLFGIWLAICQGIECIRS